MQSPLEHAEPERTLETYAVLVVDDDADALGLYAVALARLGAEVRVAKNAETALALLAVWRPDVVLCDLHLPGANGYQLLERIRADSRFRTLPVIAISASHPTIERNRSLRAGFARHLVKPSTLREIADSIVGVLAGPGAEPRLA